MNNARSKYDSVMKLIFLKSAYFTESDKLRKFCNLRCVIVLYVFNLRLRCFSSDLDLSLYQSLYSNIKIKNKNLSK